MLKTVSTANGLVSPTFSGNVTLSDGNLVQGTAGKGVNFTANTPAAGMTSQLLNWYEEGNWTPVFSNLTIISGTPTYTSTYTRVGRSVYFSIYITGGFVTSVGNTTYITLPFVAAGNHVCNTADANTITSYGSGLIQNSYIFPPSFANKTNVVITGNYSI